MAKVTIITMIGLYLDDIPDIETEEQQKILKSILEKKNCEEIFFKKKKFIGMYIGFNDFEESYYDGHDSRNWERPDDFYLSKTKKQFDKLNKNNSEYITTRIKTYG